MTFFDSQLGQLIRRRMTNMNIGQREAMTREATTLFNRAVDEGIPGAHTDPERFMFDLFSALLRRGPQQR